MVSEETKMKIEDPRFSVVMTAMIKPLKLDSDLATMSTAWRIWKQKFLIYLEANTIDKESVSRQIAIFLSLIGDDCLEIFNSFGLDRKDASLTLEIVIQKFDNKFLPHKNITVERYNFFTRKQSDEESIEEYVTKLSNMAIRCDFENLKEQLICDMFVIGISNRKIQERLLQQESLTIEKAIKIAKSIEISHRETEKLQMSNIKVEKESSVQAVKSYQKKEAINSQSKSSESQSDSHSHLNESFQSNNTIHSKSGQHSSLKTKSMSEEKEEDDEAITYLIYKQPQSRSRTDSHSSISNLSNPSINSFYESIHSDDMEMESPIFIDVNARQEGDSHDDTLVEETSSSNESKNSVISVHSSETQSPSTSYSNVQSENSSQELTENSPTQNIPLADTPKYSSRGRLIKKKQLFDL